MNLPEYIKVGPYDISVRVISSELAARLKEDGDFDGETIHIADGQRGPQLADTILHELLHAIYATFSLKDDDEEERIVSALATGLVGVLRDNPDFARWLIDESSSTTKS